MIVFGFRTWKYVKFITFGGSSSMGARKRDTLVSVNPDSYKNSSNNDELSETVNFRYYLPYSLEPQLKFRLEKIDGEEF